MDNKIKLLLFALFAAAVLAACQAAAPSATPIPPTVSAMPTLTRASTATATPTLAPSATPAPDPTLIPTQMAGPLEIVTYELKELPPEEQFTFTTVQGQSYDDVKADTQGARFPDRSYFDNGVYCMQNDLDGAHLVACVTYNPDESQSWVTLSRDGAEIYRIETGPAYPITHLQGLWVYDAHWVLETVRVTTHSEGNLETADVVGQISVDGVLLNDRPGYSELFGFQTIAGRPFYFYNRDGQIGFSYDGVETALDYDRIPHYGCCSAAILNPQSWNGGVAFLGRRGDTRYYVIISSPGQP